MADTLLHGLWQQAKWVTLAVVLVGLLRPLVRRVFGAQVACLCWAAVPAACASALLPIANLVPATLRWDAGARAAEAGVQAAVRAGAGQPLDAWLWLGPWLLGAVCVLLWGGMQQRRARSALRASSDGTHWRIAAGSSPALVGAWRPRLALPDDFEARFDTAEQRAILQHETVHCQHHDNRWNLLAFGLVALHWFNPLAWWALRRARLDQEIACDAAVLSQAQGPTKAVYMRALLKSQQLSVLLPAASHWLTEHPLVERLGMLKQSFPSRRRRWAGRCAVAVLGLLGLSVGHALQAGPDADAVRPGKAMLYLELDQDGVRFASPRLFGELGQRMAIRWSGDPRHPQVEAGEVQIVVTEQDDGRLLLSTTLKRGPELKQVSAPRLITAPGVPTRIESRAAGDTHVLGISVRAVLADAPDLAATAPR